MDNAVPGDGASRSVTAIVSVMLFVVDCYGIWLLGTGGVGIETEPGSATDSFKYSWKIDICVPK